VKRNLTRWLIPIPALLFALFPNPAKADPVAGLNAVGYLISGLPTKSDVAYPQCGSELENNINRNFDGEPFQQCGNDNFMVHYTGAITIPENQTISFMVAADDGGTVKIGDTAEFGTWNFKGCSWSTRTSFALPAGTYPLNGWFFESGGYACYMLAWSINGAGFVIVPDSAFTTQAAPTTTTTTSSSSTTTTTLEPSTTTTAPATTSIPTTTSTTLPPSTTSVQPQTTSTSTLPEPTSTSSTTTQPSTTTTSSSTTTTTEPRPVPTATTSIAPVEVSTNTEPPRELPSVQQSTTTVLPERTEPSTTITPTTLPPETTSPQVQTSVIQTTVVLEVLPIETTIPQRTPRTTQPQTSRTDPSSTLPSRSETSLLGTVPLEVPKQQIQDTQQTEEQLVEVSLQKTLVEIVENQPISNVKVEQIVQVLAGQSPAQILSVIQQVLTADITSDQAVSIASSAEVLAAVTEEQAEAIFEEIVVEELTAEVAEELVAVLNEAPTKVKKKFQETINVFAGVFDSYKMVGSTIPVGERRTLLAVSNTLVAVGASLRRRDR
jgi:hypothetical protein